jgi:hypothetical protein
MADWIEANPGIPLPTTDLLNVAVDTKEHAEAIVRSGGSCRKEFRGDSFYVTKEFGPLELRHYFHRDAVCTARVVGQEVIPEQHIEARTIPARTIDLLEWDCHPILAPTPEAGND